MKKFIGFCMLGVLLLVLFAEGFETFQSASDIIIFIVFLLIGLLLAFGDSSSASAKSTAQTTSKPVNTGTEPKKTSAAPPQSQMVCPECGKKYPLDQVYCDECGALLKKS